MRKEEWEILENLYEGNVVDRESFDVESIDRLTEMGLIDVAEHVGINTPEKDIEYSLNIDGLEIFQNREQHKDQKLTQYALVMVTSLYTVGTGGLIISNTSYVSSSNFVNFSLSILGLILILAGFGIYFLVSKFA